ncbi:MAG: hypothetical protein OEY45_10545 [Gammaproteobacteria bacterium]|nr:hypothetical protein [Gammaproteobacteria bacterium]
MKRNPGVPPPDYTALHPGYGTIVKTYHFKSINCTTYSSQAQADSMEPEKHQFHDRSPDGVKRNPGVSPRITLRCIRATALTELLIVLFNFHNLPTGQLAFLLHQQRFFYYSQNISFKSNNCTTYSSQTQADSMAPEKHRFY